MLKILSRYFYITILVLFTLSVAIYTVDILKRQLNCRSKSQSGTSSVVDEDTQRKLLQQGGLFQLYQQEKRPLPSFGEIYQERTENHGKLGKSHGRMVVWAGQVVYLKRRQDGSLKEADFYINASPCEVGDDHVHVYFKGTQNIKLENGDYVYLVGQLISPGIKNFALEINAYAITKQ